MAVLVYFGNCYYCFVMIIVLYYDVESVLGCFYSRAVVVVCCV